MSNGAPTDALRLVPVEPTPEMMNAAWVVFRNSSWHDLTPTDIDRSVGTGAFREAWSTMLAAAPASPLPGGGWQDISTAPKDEGVKVMAFDGKKVGEAVLYGEWEESNDFDEAVLRWRWANDSCSCCWGKAEPQPTHWMPLPAAPTGDA